MSTVNLKFVRISVHLGKIYLWVQEVTDMRYGEVLEYYIEYAGITRAELAKRTKMSRGQIGDLITGRTKEPGLTKAKIIANCLGVPLQDMIDMMSEFED